VEREFLTGEQVRVGATASGDIKQAADPTGKRILVASIDRIGESALGIGLARLGVA
jgi:hypothetical protein